MKASSANPLGNALPPGLDEAAVAQSILKSGYPLQVLVASQLSRSGLAVQQEWCYADRDTGTLRTIDILAGKRFFRIESDDQPRVRPTLNLMLECKQSPLPYVFFAMDSATASHFPMVAGLASDKVTITTDDDRSTWTLSVLQALGLERHPFMAGAPVGCATFSKCVRKGSDLELSGSDPYSSVVLPILKAVRHFRKAERPPKTAYYFDFHFVIPVAVLDAPMISIGLGPGGPELTLSPWVRVFRHEYSGEEERWDRQQMLAVDVVHKEFLGSYLSDHVFPFSRRLGSLALKHQDELAESAGFARGMGANSWTKIEQRLTPKTHRKRKASKGAGA